MKKNVVLCALLVAGMGFGLTGCTSKPTAISADEAVIPTAGSVSASEFQFSKPRFGRFNIHKRHGLGGWEGGASRGSEQELLRDLSKSP